jgi:hypothetical protein
MTITRELISQKPILLQINQKPYISIHPKNYFRTSIFILIIRMSLSPLQSLNLFVRFNLSHKSKMIQFGLLIYVD